MESNFISRWVEISGRAFRYYKNQISSFAGLNRPLVSIPKPAIASIKKLKLNKELFLPKDQFSEKYKFESKLFDHLFEIELKECYEDLFRFRDEEIELVKDIKEFTKPRRAATPTK
jgi:hypothetical protein